MRGVAGVFIDGAPVMVGFRPPMHVRVPRAGRQGAWEVGHNPMPFPESLGDDRPMDFARRAALQHVAALAGMAALPAARAAAGAREQCEALQRAALSMAHELLRSHGEFAPYGIGLSAGEEVVELEEPAPRDGLRGSDAGDALRATLADALKN